MLITTIPAPYRLGFGKIKGLSPAEYEALATALETAPTTGGLKKLASAIVKQVPTLKRADIEVILRSLFSLRVFLADEETPLSENLSSLSSAMQASGKADLALTEQEKIEFEKRLDRLLKINAVTMSAKVQRLEIDYPNTFYEALILTDMRPIFDKPEDRPVGCAVSHTLKITYHESGEHKEFYVVLDADDLQTMKKVLQRAEAKASSIKSFLNLASLPDLS
ncbi:MAG TPA: hypothetical protein VEH86_01735 [Candidatus Acidoferrum sp.]|nr:hypothetical protein [Candidatus Acidoferrum sp.]